MSEQGLRIGMDIGGTSIKAVRVEAGHVDDEHLTIPAGARLDRAALLAALTQVVRLLGRGDQVAHIGIAVGGVVRPDGTIPIDATNLPALAETPLAELFASHLGVPCSVLNDAQAAMHGEAWRGAAQGLSDVLTVTFGTGIGAGLMLGGRVRRGAHGHAGEIGVWPIIGGGTFEALASPVKFELRTGRRLGDALGAGDTDADVEAALDAIGRGLAAAHLLLDLEAVVIGGGMAVVGETLRGRIETAIARHCPGTLWNHLTVVTSALGPYAGAIGAVAPAAIGAAV